MRYSEIITEAAQPYILRCLAAEARKAGSFDNFKHDFVLETKHGIYWHWTHDPHFQIDPTKGPRDMSSMSNGQMTAGKLMVTSHLAGWEDEYKDDRSYVALIDMSGVPRADFYQSKRGFGNEFYVENPAGARVVKVVSPSQAKAFDRSQRKYLPDSEEELRALYDRVVSGPRGQISDNGT